MPRFKVTKVRDYRINFRYGDTLYSLNEHNEEFDFGSSVTLRNMNTREEIHSLPFDMPDIFDAICLCPKKPGITYREWIDEDRLYDFFCEMKRHKKWDETIVGIVKIDNEKQYLERRIESDQKRILEYQAKIDKYYNDMFGLDEQKGVKQNGNCRNGSFPE